MDDRQSIIRDLVESEAVAIERRFQAMHIRYYIFETNFDHLKDFATRVNNPEQILNQAEMDSLSYELIRLVHNFLASAKMLTDHCRRLIRKWYKDTELLREYNNEVAKRFKSNPLTRFVEDLRNMTLHHSIALVSANIEFERRENSGSYSASSTLALSRSHLREWSGWTKGREFLAASEEDIALDELFGGYFQEINNFHHWLNNRLLEEHKENLRWLDEKREKARKLFSSEILAMKSDVQSYKNVPRNAPCPCGSDKKYKLCHGKPGDTAKAAN